MNDVDITIIGAGVVGLAIAARLSQRNTRILLLEKNKKYGMETSSRNSEVIHAGMYYKPGSLKATLCVEGRDELYSLCKTNNIPFRQITKIITAATESELPKLEALYHNGIANGVELQFLTAAETKQREPNIQTFGSIFSPTTGIISVHSIMDYFFHTANNNGVIIQEQCKVTGIEKINDGYKLLLDESGNPSTVTTEKIVNAAGLYADDVAAMAGIDVDAAGYRIIFCKGSYFSVIPAKSKLVSRLVYPSPSNESLGVHALLDLGGRLKFGPDVEYLEGKNINYTVSEDKRKQFIASIQRILPSITEEDISPDMSGIRPKLQQPGSEVKDFIIADEAGRGLPGLINVIGIDSPGLTSSPAIARYVETLLFA